MTSFKKISVVRYGMCRRRIHVSGWWSAGIDPVTHDYIRRTRSFSDMLFELHRERIPYLANPMGDDATIVYVFEYDDHGSLCFEFEYFGELEDEKAA